MIEMLFFLIIGFLLGYFNQLWGVTEYLAQKLDKLFKRCDHDDPKH